MRWAGRGWGGGWRVGRQGMWRWKSLETHAVLHPFPAVLHVLQWGCQISHMVLDVAANLLQYKGGSQGMWLDPETFEILVRTQA